MTAQMSAWLSMIASLHIPGEIIQRSIEVRSDMGNGAAQRAELSGCGGYRRDESSDGKIVFRDDDLLARRQSMNEFGKLCLGFFDGDLRHAVILMQVQKSRIALAVFEERLWRVCESKQPKLTF